MNVIIVLNFVALILFSAFGLFIKNTSIMFWKRDTERIPGRILAANY